MIEAEEAFRNRELIFNLNPCDPVVYESEEAGSFSCIDQLLGDLLFPILKICGGSISI
jgi:hypothetical protein